ncbi:MAG: aminoglycoside phosphotransferase family protein [Rhodobacteraceae bacterium]|nr:aminoglycoside phosphotransferase family protein [Paracoccaceae bacterium]
MQDIDAQLRSVADQVAGLLEPGHDQDELQADILKRSDHATALLVRVGDHRGFLKLFADTDAAKAAFGREKQALDLLHGTHVPRLLMVGDDARAVLTVFIEGRPLGDLLTASNLMQRAEQIGQLFGTLASRAPAQTETADWAAYLGRYETGLSNRLLAQQRPVLEQNKIKRLHLAQNDAALSNFIQGKDKRLYLVDFENARMKPEGWDLAMAARALFGRFPDQLNVISNSLLRGYRLAAKDCGLADNFDQVINVLVVAMIASEG